MDEKELIKKVMERFGEDNQIIQFYEELNELGCAVNHYRRGKVNKQFLINEISDVLFMINQIKYIYCIDDFELSEGLEFTKERLKSKLNEEGYK